MGLDLDSAQNRRITALIQHLGSRDPKVREDAALELHSLGPEIEFRLIASLDADMSYHMLRAIRRWCIGVLVGVVFVALMSYGLPHVPVISGVIHRYRIEIVLICGAIADAGSGLTVRQREIIQLLTQSSWAGAVEPLLKYRKELIPEQQTEAKKAIVRLLPHLRPVDVTWSDVGRHEKFVALCYGAMKDRDPDFVAAVIEVLGRIGDSDSIGHLQQAAKRDNSHIQAAAMIAIDKIRERSFVQR